MRTIGLQTISGISCDAGHTVRYQLCWEEKKPRNSLTHPKVVRRVAGRWASSEGWQPGRTPRAGPCAAAEDRLALVLLTGPAIIPHHGARDVNPPDGHPSDHRDSQAPVPAGADDSLRLVRGGHNPQRQRY